MPKKKANDCQDCQHFSFEEQDREDTGVLCAQGHRPRFYAPRSPMPRPDEWGWKRRCDDFKRVLF